MTDGLYKSRNRTFGQKSETLRMAGRIEDILYGEKEKEKWELSVYSLFSLHLIQGIDHHQSHFLMKFEYLEGDSFILYFGQNRRGKEE